MSLNKHITHIEFSLGAGQFDHNDQAVIGILRCSNFGRGHLASLHIPAKSFLREKKPEPFDIKKNDIRTSNDEKSSLLELSEARIKQVEFKTTRHIYEKSNLKENFLKLLDENQGDLVMWSRGEFTTELSSMKLPERATFCLENVNPAAFLAAVVVGFSENKTEIPVMQELAKIPSVKTYIDKYSQ